MSTTTTRRPKTPAPPMVVTVVYDPAPGTDAKAIRVRCWSTLLAALARDDARAQAQQQQQETA